MDDRPLPLTGIRIVDCSRVLAGPFATMLLADLGADVVKLEPPAGDESRSWGPPWWGAPGDRRSAYFASVNRNKRSVVVDLRTDGGRAALDRLAATADLLFHNHRPSVARRLGIDADAIRRRHPNLLVVSVGGFPGDARERERPAYDLLAQAVTGWMAVTGEPGRPPVRIGAAFLDLLAGMEAAIGALAGLLARAGKVPGRVEVSLVEAGVASLTNVLGNLLASGDEPVRLGSAHPNIVPYQAFAARDGDLIVAVGNDDQFAALLDELSIPAESRFATNADRVAHRDALVEALSEAIGRRDRDDLVAALAARDVPAGPVHGVGAALRAMELAHPEGWTEERDGIRVAPSPIRIDGASLPLRLAPPRLGEHTASVLEEAGLSAAEVERLRQTGALG